MKRLLITGASGFLGGHVYQQALNHWHVFAGYGSNLPETFADKGEWVSLELQAFKTLREALQRLRPDVVVHSAAISNLDLCEKDPDFAFAVNTKSTEILGHLSLELDFRLVFISTDMVFDGTASMYKETDPVSPISVYGQSKVKAEEKLIAMGANAVCLRSALIYGRAVTGGNSFSMWLENKLNSGEPVALFQDQYRTPILVNNLARIILELAEHDYTGIMHAGGADRVDRYTFGHALCEIGGYPVTQLSANSMHDFKSAAPRPVDVSLDISLINRTCETPVLGIKDGLCEMFASSGE